MLSCLETRLSLGDEGLARAREIFGHHAEARRTRVDALGYRFERHHRPLERRARHDGSGLDPAVVHEECARALEELGRRILPRHGQHVLAVQRGGRSGLAQDGGDVLLERSAILILPETQSAAAHLAMMTIVELSIYQ
jgi:hypothetical protein